MDHGDTQSRYAHMISSPVVSKGQQLAQGALLGQVGSTGRSSGPHLHFEILTGKTGSTSNSKVTRVDPNQFIQF